MPAFELFQPTSVNDALGVLNRHGADAWVMAGGMDTFDWLKDRIKKPKVVVDLGMINDLRGIKDAGAASRSAPPPRSPRSPTIRW